MPINLTPGKEQVSLVNNKPLAYVTVVAVLFAGTMTGLYVNSNSSRSYDCRDRVTYLENENKELKAQVKYLFERDSQRTLDFEELKKNTNSVLRAAIDKTPLKK